MLLRYSCGCIGFKVGDVQRIVKACDRDYTSNEYALWKSHRLMINKTYEPLTDDETNKILDDLAMLVRDGYKFKELKQLLS